MVLSGFQHLHIHQHTVLQCIFTPRPPSHTLFHQLLILDTIGHTGHTGLCRYYFVLHIKGPVHFFFIIIIILWIPEIMTQS